MICLLAIPVMADTNYLSVAIREDVKHSEKIVSKLKLKDYFDDPEEVDWDQLTRYFKLAPTSNNWRIVTFTVKVGAVDKPSKKKGDITEWILQNVPASERDKFDIMACGERPVIKHNAEGYFKIKENPNP